MKLNVVDEIVAGAGWRRASRDHEKAAQILSEALRSNLKRLLKTPNQSAAKNVTRNSVASATLLNRQRAMAPHG